MLPQHYTQKLLDLQDQLLELYLDEANPENWTTKEAAKEQADQALKVGVSKTEAFKIACGWKGERYWEKKNANQTMTLLLNINRLLDSTAGKGTGGEDQTQDLRRDIKRVERDVKKRLSRSRPQIVRGGKA